MSVKSPKTLLKLSKNPFYKLTPSQQRILDDFLSKKSGSRTTSSPKKKSKKPAKTTPAIVDSILDDAPTVTRNYFERNTGEIEEEEVLSREEVGDGK